MLSHASFVDSRRVRCWRMELGLILTASHSLAVSSSPAALHSLYIVYGIRNKENKEITKMANNGAPLSCSASILTQSLKAQKTALRLTDHVRNSCRIPCIPPVSTQNVLPRRLQRSKQNPTYCGLSRHFAWCVPMGDVRRYSEMLKSTLLTT